tara:strand:+ start:1935 stop:2264 length:330 start_codon:yes stop_codon:yes gene_type:complete
MKLQRAYEHLSDVMVDLSKAKRDHIKNGYPDPQTHSVVQHISIAMADLQLANVEIAAVLFDMEANYRENEYKEMQEQKDYASDFPDPSIFKATSNPSWNLDEKVVEDGR